MMEWLWGLVGLFGGTAAGVLAMALAVQGKRNEEYGEGFEDGFVAGKARARIEEEAKK